MEPAASLWRFELFGGLYARRGETDTRIERFQTRKTEALLAYLALHPGRRFDREALVDLLWPDAPSDAGRNRLTQAVVWLRPLLEPPGVERGSVLVADRQSVALNAGALITDVAEFERTLRQVGTEVDTGAISERQAQLLQATVEQYRGPLLPRLDEEWVVTLRQQFLDRYLWALHHLVAYEEAVGNYASGLAYARRAQAADPLAEEVYLDLVRLLAASGQMSAARRQYREMERLLADTLGEEPSPAAQALFTSLRTRERELSTGQAIVARPASAPVATPAPTPAPPPLPAPLTRFFGRTDEVTRLQQLLRTPTVRLVTLVGMGGAGKTRLAVETARAVSGDTASGTVVWFLPLADLDDARQIPDSLADLMRLPRTSGTPPLQNIVAAFAAADRPTLLVLDNLEHLLDEAPVLIRTLLEQSPTLTILGTSRQRLGLEGEQEWPVLPLSVPQEGGSLAGQGGEDPEALAQNDSVCLFVDRARAIRPGFALTPQNAAVVARLCGRLEGLPLALELCAAWAQTLTPAQMLAQLTHRFDLLVSRRADIPARHRSLRAVLENSYLLLPPDTQPFFLGLSVFRGGWTLDAAAAVCLEEDTPARTLTALQHITELRERSLVVAEEEEANAEEGVEGSDSSMRYRMLETVREFAAQQRTLALDAQVRRRHLAYFLELAETAELEVQGPSQVRWLMRQDAELDNLRAALAWCIEVGEVVAGLRLASALTFFWETRGHLAEGQEKLEKLLDLAGVETIPGEANVPPQEDLHLLRAKSRQAQARLARAQAAFATAQTAAEDALRLWTERGDRRGRVEALLILASVAYTHQDYSRARAMQEEALLLARQEGNSLLTASALMGLGNVAMEEEEWGRAWLLYEECLALYRKLNNRVRIADTLNNMGLIARYRGDLATARALLEEDLEIGRALANRSGTAVTLLNMATVLRLQGEYDRARAALREATLLARDVGNRRALAWCIKESGHLACASGAYAVGVRLLAASENLRQSLGMSFKPADPEALETDSARMRALLGDAAFEAHWTAGSSLTLADASREALAALGTA